MSVENLIPESAEDKAFFETERASEQEAPPPSAPAPASTPEPPPVPDAVPEPQAEPERQKMVPHEALHEERRRRQELQEQMRDMERRFRELSEKVAPPQQEPPEPDPEADPLEYLKLKGRQFDEYTKEAKRRSEYNEMMTQFRNRLDAVEADFRQSAPDYDDAVRFAVNARNEELRLLGYADPAERNTVIQREVIDLAQRCFQSGTSPAEAFYNYSKLRGYAAKPAPEPPSAEAPPIQAAQEKVASLAAKQSVARSPSSANGAPPKNISIENLDHLSDDEFERHFDEVWRNT